MDTGTMIQIATSIATVAFTVGVVHASLRHVTRAFYAHAAEDDKIHEAQEARIRESEIKIATLREHLDLTGTDRLPR